MRHNVKPHAVSQACRSSCPGASGLCFRVAAPSPHTDGSWRLADAGERRVGGRGGVRGNAIAFAWCRAPLAADKHLWTSQAACNKQHGWCHRSPCGLGANWSATCLAKPWVDISRVENLETSPGQVLWIKVFLLNLTSSNKYPNCLHLSSSFAPPQTWERILRRSRWVKRWHWTRRCYCTANPPRECHKPRWDTDTEDIYRPTSSIHLPFPHQEYKEQKVAQDQLPGISLCSTRERTTLYG